MFTKAAATTGSQLATETELADELRQAEHDFATGGFVELTVEALDRCIAAGEWPWQHASSA